MEFWPPDDENMCSKHVEAWNKTYCKTKILCINLVNHWDKFNNTAQNIPKTKYKDYTFTQTSVTIKALQTSMKDKKQFDTAQTLRCVVSTSSDSTYPDILKIVFWKRKVSEHLQFHTSLILPENKKKKIQSLPKPSQCHAVS